MTNQEAKDYLKWYDDKSSEYLYLAHFKSSRPFHLDYPEAAEKMNRAKWVFKKHTFSYPFEKVQRVFPNLTEKIYNEKRNKLIKKFGSLE